MVEVAPETNSAIALEALKAIREKTNYLKELSEGSHRWASEIQQILRPSLVVLRSFTLVPTEN